MKSIKEKPGKDNQDNKATNTAAKRASGNNEMNSGEIGAEGGNYNGASELRQLRNKRK